MSKKKMREEFEAAYVEEMVRQNGEFFRSSAEQSIRMNTPMVEIALWDWQASRAAVVIELPSTEVFGSGVDDFALSPEKLRTAIEAVGLKVKP